jgi:hypothetical protein
LKQNKKEIQLKSTRRGLVAICFRSYKQCHKES